MLKTMNDYKKIEPGLIEVFRLFLLIQLAFLLLVIPLSLIFRDANTTLTRIALRGTGLLIVLGYLNFDWLFRRLKQFYLPVALGLAVLEIILTQLIGLKLSPGLNESAAMAIQGNLGVLTITLLIPVLMVAWQYRFQEVIFFSLSVYAFYTVLVAITWNIGIVVDPTYITVILFGLIIHLAIGYFISRLVNEQRMQRNELRHANRKLAHMAATLDQLATTRERNRVARELHDTLAHAQSGLAVQLEGIDALWNVDQERAYQMLHQAISTIRSSMNETRQAIQALRLSPLEDFGLWLAIEELAKSVASRTQIEVETFQKGDMDNLSPDIELAIYRVAQEGLSNIVRHAHANYVNVSLQRDFGRILLTISDNGRGFDMDGAKAENKFGLQGMQERIESLGGQLTIQSAPGKGTIVRVEIEDEQ